MDIIDNKKSPMNTDCSSTSSIAASLNYYNSLISPKTGLNTENPFSILSTCLPSSKMFSLSSYNLVQTYPISPCAYFANIAKGTNTTSTNNNSICTVCGDISNGKHYGILACNGCSGFFKRSIRRKLIYQCQTNSNMCIIDKVHRNQCQACRFKKCLQMGMIKEAVQNERQPRNHTQINLHTGKIISVLHPRPSQQTNFISDLSPMTKQTEYDFVNHLDDTISSQILLMIIKWIRNIPTFLNLPIHDQRILLEESWAELFLLWAIQYSISLDNGGPLFSSVLYQDKLIDDVFYIFKQLKIHSIEFACLKAIVLFRSDIRTLKEVKIIENLQDQAQITLAQLTQIPNPTRFGRLLLTLPLLRSIPSIFIEKTYFSHTIDHISISKLLVDMLKN